MKKILLSVIAMFAIVATNAATVEFTVDNTWTEVTDPTYGAGFETENGGVTVALLQGGSSSSILNPSDAGQIRHYKSSTMLIKSNATITNVVFTTTGGTNRCNNVEINGETVTADTKSYTITWEGSASELVVSANEAQNRYSKIAVTTEDAAGSVAAPTFSPAGGTYYEAQEVTLSAEDGANIYYTTNGDDPTTSSAEYSDPIKVAQTTTIKAIAVKESKSSAVASATYTIVEIQTVNNISEYLKLDEGAMVKFANPVTVTYQYDEGYYTYAKDETGSMLIYGPGAGTLPVYKNGDVIPSGFYGKKVQFRSTPQLSTQIDGGYSNDSFVEATENNGPISPVEVSITEAGNSKNVNAYVVFKNIQLADVNDRSASLSDGNNTFPVYNQFVNYLTELPVEGSYENVVGIIANNNANDVFQFLPIEFNAKLSGVEGVAAEGAVKVLGLDGEIAIVGEAADVEVYNMGGALIAKGNLERVSCPQGIYVVKVDGNVQKVIVK